MYIDITVLTSQYQDVSFILQSALPVSRLEQCIFTSSTIFVFQQKWVAILSAEYPTMAFHASITNPFGKGALINLLRQFGKVCDIKN